MLSLFMFTNHITFGILNFQDPVIIAAIAGMAPYGFWIEREIQRRKSIEERLPEFLRDIAESGRFGMTLAAAIQSAAKGRYGTLTDEIRKMADQIAWGVSAVEALRLFQERNPTPLINRVVGIVIKAASAGGNVSDVLTLVSQDLRENTFAQEERKNEMLTYLVVIYIAFLVFLATVVILNAIFIPQIESFVAAQSAAQAANSNTAADAAAGSSAITAADVEEIKFIYLAAAIVHGLGDGFVVGMLTKGRLSAGMMHSVVLVLSAYAALRLLVLIV